MNQHLISQEGLEKLKEELETRMKITRREIADQIGSAKEQGDLSENFEYQDAKDRQAENESKIIELKDKISRAIIVEADGNTEEVRVGSKVLVSDDSGAEKEYEIVGSTESDPISGRISHISPLGNAFLGAKPGQVVEFESPAGVKKFKVISIS